MDRADRSTYAGRDQVPSWYVLRAGGEEWRLTSSPPQLTASFTAISSPRTCSSALPLSVWLNRAAELTLDSVTACSQTQRTSSLQTLVSQSILVRERSYTRSLEVQDTLVSCVVFKKRSSS